MSNQKEINRRRTFAIISHPDAGKTTLTEKLLLFGGAIQVAGAVKSNKIKKTATSDWMEIERQRGISVATSVMGFEYNDVKINILDTPGHQDFQEDTFRTLTAADSVVVVIDVAKGVEPQTEKLVKVCRMRNIPIIVFINKLDRPGKDAFDLLDEVEQKLHLTVTPLSWPINMGPSFKGVYNIFSHSLNLFSPGKQIIEEGIAINNLEDKKVDDYLKEDADQLREDVELIENVYPKFEIDSYLGGKLSPVFFGSALNNFGVKELLDNFIQIAPSPIGRESDIRKVLPEEKSFTGFVFKIHANMDPKHRDRIAFVRIVSGVFKRNTYYQHVRLNRKLKFSSPTSFMAQKKSIVDEMYPGDIVGLHDTGNFKIGDTITDGETLNYKGIPSFSPELFKYIENASPMKAKQLAKGIDQLMDEGVAQLFTGKHTGRKIIGTVGALQFEVIQYRLEHEYGAKCRFEHITLYKTVWYKSSDQDQLKDFRARKATQIALDKDGREVFLADSQFSLQMAQQKYNNIEFFFTSEF
ncbi:MAG: peptide chain release factor 3 [Lentimicrobiaceae bacterium]|jgi:peptide chain release factor 3|nr:peptide chain release factor 3 [Lentimicrobiaceae bacterium]MCP4909800.1 peptide chain release factor 3 [Bacteroidota bacterium]MBT3454097.1 peptide chain release factor 3 [Lentimicrobiaceae bacterium]MBT3819369.1 peptide chain release factor 3 [Lentimicrobiaceae bacterium]MBT4062327.1 peptide chain release factor 3 [Lentimicrobiaceae bacterium]